MRVFRMFGQESRKREKSSGKRAKEALHAKIQEAEYDRKYNATTPLGRVYLIMITPFNEERYYKIGFTATNVFARFSKEDNIPSYVRICETNLMPAADARGLEKTLHEAFKKKAYLPPHRFGGFTECFKLDAADIQWITEICKK